MHNINIADFMHTYADGSRHYADLVQTIIYVCNWRTYLLSSVANVLTVLLFLQDLRGVKGTDPCWLLPGAKRGREAGDQG